MQKQTPERIYHWLDSQLSIARHYGGCKYNGAEYVIAYSEEGQPLVRSDLIKKPKRDKRKSRVSAELSLQPNAELTGAEKAQLLERPR